MLQPLQNTPFHVKPCFRFIELHPKFHLRLKHFSLTQMWFSLSQDWLKTELIYTTVSRHHHKELDPLFKQTGLYFRYICKNDKSLHMYSFSSISSGLPLCAVASRQEQDVSTLGKYERNYILHGFVAEISPNYRKGMYWINACVPSLKWSLDSLNIILKYLPPQYMILKQVLANIWINGK